MKAAVVHAFDAPPCYQDFDLPEPEGPDEVLVQVLAAGLHPRVRSGASGTHYADVPVLPMIPGVDAVGRLPDGTLVYCVVHDTPHGTMAERVIADRRRCVPLPEGTDEAVIAAAMNPAMSSWLALRLRAPLRPGQSVFVLGATGNAGQMAIQIAKRLGAGTRRRRRTRALSTRKVGGRRAGLAGRRREVGQRRRGQRGAECDIVLDYLWGQPALDSMIALLTARQDRSRPLDWVQIGSVAGPNLALPSAALRSANLRLQGSGQGSLSVHQIVGELPRLVEELVAGRITVNPLRVPLAEVETAWHAALPSDRRVVFVP